jgi:predicted esterase
MSMPAWYDISSFDRTKEDAVGMDASCKTLQSIIDDEAKLVPTEKILFGGFSMGGAMTVLVGYTYPRKLAGLVACGAYLVQKDTVFPARMSEANRDTPLIAAHGEEDSTYVVRECVLPTL